jgi:hypothetical protein
MPRPKFAFGLSLLNAREWVFRQPVLIIRKEQARDVKNHVGNQNVKHAEVRGHVSWLTVTMKYQIVAMVTVICDKS